MTDSVFEKLGGDEAVNVAVDLFYGKVLADERIKHFFTGVDMSQQKAHMKRFMKYAFGGITNYNGKSLRNAHKHLVEEMGLSDKHFDAVLENLGSTLKDIGVDDALIAEAAQIVESTRSDVLNK
ncbi:MAG: group 1 truncated hemoglobin [Gammaproteobacteria bacterium]|jgi:hemoglobin|nr:group 1 truncated hemoglobin [Gammaproteobacteria bacterium]MBT7603463.1 group 1 truncated hemoglobin [Gammaproteobacteria bacterium]